MEASTRALTLDRVLVPGSGVLRDAILVGSAVLATAICAQLAIPLPWSPVPVTAQTLAVLLTGAALGSRRGALAMLLYMVGGSLGLPLFTGARAGGFWLLSTGGYLLGFVAAAWLVGLLAERGWDRRPRVIFAMLLGNAVIYAFGLPWLALFIASSEALQTIPGTSLLDKTLYGGLWPFVAGDAIKLALASAALPAAWVVARRRV